MTDYQITIVDALTGLVTVRDMTPEEIVIAQNAIRPLQEATEE